MFNAPVVVAQRILSRVSLREVNFIRNGTTVKPDQVSIVIRFIELV